MIAGNLAQCANTAQLLVLGALPTKAFRRSIVVTRRIEATGSGDDSSMNDMFKKELERRNISSVDDIVDTPTMPKSPFGGRGRGSTPPPPFSREEDEVPPQLKKSRELNSEGLEGLIPRASALVQLGLSFFLAFGPFIIGVALAFAAIYAVFGDAFVHTGLPSTGPSPYINSQDLLNEPTVDPMIPM